MDSHWPRIERLLLISISLDRDLQPRAEIDRAIVEQYSQCLMDGAKFPPVVIFDDDGTYWLADGYHRYFACRDLGITEIDSEIRTGPKSDALLFSLAANHAHGKQRNDKDYRRSYEIVVSHGIADPWNAVAIAKIIMCSSRWSLVLTAAAREAHDAELRSKAEVARAEGKSNRATGRELGVNHETIAEWTGGKTHSAKIRHDDASNPPQKPARQNNKNAPPPVKNNTVDHPFPVSNRPNDLAPETPAEEVFSSISDEAQRWSVGRHLVIQSDCLTQLLHTDTASIDVIVTSPPYNIGIDYHSHSDDMERHEYLRWLTTIATELRRVLRPDGSFFLNVGSTNKDPWIEMDVVQALRDLFVLQNHIRWVKSIAVGLDMIGHYKPITSKRFLNQNCESIFHFTISGEVEIDRLAIGRPYEDKSNIERRGHMVDLHCAGNAWFIPYDTVQSKAEKFDHPAGFPVGLAERCIRMHGVRDGLSVLDPFLGAGTTLVAAETLGCCGIGIEIDLVYAKAAVKRLGRIVHG